MRDYDLNIRFSFKAMDHMEARIKAKEMLEETKLTKDAKVKLQEIFADKEPRKVEI